jgi:hypothetical protein
MKELPSVVLLAGNGETFMTLMPTTLRLETAAGVDEYRIWEGAVEVRTLHRPSEQLFDEEVSTYGWRRLNHHDLSRHVKDNTVVAQWLRHRIGWQRVVQLCADPQTLEEFGIACNTLDRHAA